MAFEITIPRLGWSMEEGIFAGWMKKDGDVVRPGDVLFELEGEKALQEIEALDEGILRIPPDCPAPGSVLKVGVVIGWLVSDNEAAPWESESTTGAPSTAAESGASTDVRDADLAQHAAASPSIRRLARSLGITLTQVVGTGVQGRLTEDDVRTAASRRLTSHTAATATNAWLESQATPRARRTAKRLGIDWKKLTGTGRNGRVRERDVLAVEKLTPSGQTSQSGLRIPISGRRKVIADRLSASVRETVSVTITSRANATNLVSLRAQFKSVERAVVPAYHDIIAKLLGGCLIDAPLLAGRREGDEIVLAQPDGIHIGLAVDTPEGLIVPVIRNVVGQSLPTLASETARIIRRAKEGRLSANEMQGAVFTITNLGRFGIDAFTPVINSPETAILGLGAIRTEPVVTDDERIIVGQVITLSLTFDHRSIDGAPAARFLQSLVKAIENPAACLLA